MEVGGDRRSAEFHAALSKQGWVGTQGTWEFECRVSHLGGDTRLRVVEVWTKGEVSREDALIRSGL